MVYLRIQYSNLKQSRMAEPQSSSSSAASGSKDSGLSSDKRKNLVSSDEKTASALSSALSSPKRPIIPVLDMSLSGSPSSSFKKLEEVQILQVPKKQTNTDPSSNPNGPGRNKELQGRVSQMFLKVLKTENELEIERQASGQVTGPLDKKWENYGVAEADDSDQLIDVDKQLSKKKMLQIKETVNAQMHEVIRDKRGWAYYEKHQPDYASFQIEVKKMIMELIGPTVTENTKNANEIESVKKMQQNLAKNMHELEFVYKRVVKNFAAQQDALTDLETRSKALRITEERLREQVKACSEIKDQLSEKFKLLRDDRAFFVARIDHTDHEVQQYRKDIRQVHEQLNKQFLSKLAEVQATALTGQRSVEEQMEKNDALNTKFDQIIQGDFRDQQVKLAQLVERNIVHQELINILDRSIVSQINWDEKNKHYDHQINILAAAFNQVQSEFHQIKKDMQEKLSVNTQNQINNTLVAVLGDRKKYMKALQKHSDQFFDGQLDENNPGSKDQLSQNLKRRTSVKSPIGFPENSEDRDSDKSEDRLQRHLANLQASGKLKLGGGLEGNVNQEEVIDMLQKHNDQQFEKVRAIFCDKIPIRRQARYVEQASEFVCQRFTKLRILDRKQVSSLNLSAFKYLSVEQERKKSLSRLSASRLSGSISQSGSRKSLPINGNSNENMPKRTSSLHSKVKNDTKIILPKPEARQETKLQEKTKWEAALVQLDKIEINTIFNNLNTSQKFKIAKAISDELEKRKHLLDSSKMLKVKNKTIVNAIIDCQSEHAFQMTAIQISAVVTVLCLKEVLDDNGVKIKTDFIDKKLGIIQQMIELENEGSEENSSQDSRHRRHNFGLKPPAIETQLATDRSAQRRSKTMQPENTISKRNDSSASSIEVKHRNELDDLKSVDSEDSSISGLSESVKTKPLAPKPDQRSLTQQRPPLDLRSTTQQQPPIQIPEKSASHSSKSALKEQQKQKVNQPKTIDKTEKIQAYAQRVKSMPPRDRSMMPLSYGEDSYDYPEESVSLDSKIGTEFKVFDKDFEPPPVFTDVPTTTDQILVRMKQQIDELDSALKDRTNEIRELKNYVQRFEDSIITELEKNFKQVYLKMDYNVADLKDLINMRIKLVGNKMVNNKKQVAQNKDQAELEYIAMQKRVKVFGRIVNQRLDEVNKDHACLEARYDLLIHQNDYFAKMAEQMITITELNSCLQISDEKDKESICLLGSKGIKNIKEQHLENHLKRLQQQIEDQSDDKKTGSGTQEMRPQTDVSHMSQKSRPLSIKTNQTRQSKIDGEETPVIQVDKRCITCSDDRGQLIQLFKIACLAYFPSKVEYKAKKYDKKVLISKQTKFVNDLRSILQNSGTNPMFDEKQPFARQGAVKVRSKQRLGVHEDEESQDFELETQINSDKFGAIVSSEANSRQIQPSAKRVTSEASLLDATFEPTHPGNTNNAQQSNLRKHDTAVQFRQTPSNRIQSPQSLAETENLTAEKSQTERSQKIFDEKVQVDQKQRPLKIQRVSFDENEDQLMQFQQQQQFTAQKTQTSFRFNSSHELLAFNQEQIQKLLPKPISTGAPIDSKLMQIQKLKEKALMIQLSREVNNPNNFIAKARESQTPQSHPKTKGGDFFFSKEQYEQARDMARMKHEKETKLMIDTRERFTKRFQFEKLSHQPLSSALSNTQLSGSQNNELAHYESKTIFRNVKRDPSAERVPKNYSHLIENAAASLPSLTRNMSAQQRHYKTSEELLQMNQPRQAVLQHIRGRNQRPISSMNEQTSKPFWRTARQSDGRTMIIVNQDRTKAGIEWNRTRQSSNTDQINKMLGGTGDLSLANFSQQ